MRCCAHNTGSKCTRAYLYVCSLAEMERNKLVVYMYRENNKKIVTHVCVIDELALFFKEGRRPVDVL